MIKCGIIGGSNPMAGELIRLLINHPDVAIKWVDSVRYTGRLVSDVHHGLLGETDLRISPTNTNSLDDINALFIFRHKGQTLEWLAEHTLPEDLRIIDLSVDMREADNAKLYGFVYGLPELNRKAMVRGAQRAVVPHPVAMLCELSLLPLAKAQALNSPISYKVCIPKECEEIESEDAVMGEIKAALKELYPEFDAPIALQVSKADDERTISSVIGFDTTLDIGEIIMLFEDFYDDHNFTFIVNEPVEAKEVEGTNKCLIHIDKHDGRCTITSKMDAMLKGAAGTGVHDMNLLFGLHERVGLALKASIF